MADKIKVVKKTTKVNGKNKGSTFERKMANKLSARFEKITGIQQSFKRNADSGSFFGGSNQRRLLTHDTTRADFGDLICPATFAYSVECKHYKKPPSFSNIMQQDYKEWDAWLLQATQDSKNSKKKMLLIIKYNNVDELAILDEPISGIANIPYKQYFVVNLKEFLEQDDSVFFE